MNHFCKGEIIYNQFYEFFSMASNYLVLEDGTIIEGESFGYEADAVGEVVFTTVAGGYQECMTDPSYRGQILIFTYPLIGDGGVTPDCEQSDDVQVRGIVVRECCDAPSQMYKGKPLAPYLKEHKIPAIQGIDTRDLTVKIRTEGSFKGAIVTDRKKAEEMASKLKSMPSPYEENLVGEVSTKKVYDINNKKKVTVGVIDCGVKKGIIAELSSRFNIKVFPYDTPAEAIISSGVQGVLVSSGAGDPRIPEMAQTVKTVKEVAQKLPVMGICYGGLVIALAFGAKIVKLKFGHRGENQPVKVNGKVLATYQCHTFAVDADSLKGTGLVADQFNINDGTVEGFRHESLPVFMCQYHPEGCPGPMDTVFFFDEFLKKVQEAVQ